MGLAGEYNDVLLTELLIEELKDGEIPTIQQLNDSLAALKLEYPLATTKPMFSIKDNSVNYYENASASKHNDTFERAEKDIHVLYDVMHELQKRWVAEGNRWSTFYENIRRISDDLEDRVDTLLLMKTDTLGYYKYVSDDFLTLDFVDLDNTTAEVETNSGVVSIGHNEIQGEGESRVSLDDVTSSNITVSTVDGPGVVGITNAPGSLTTSIISDESISWLAFLSTTEQNKPATVSVSIKLTDTNELVEFNKVVAMTNGSTATSTFIITLWYSQNGHDWLLVPTDSHTQSTLDSATWSFPNIQAKYIKFLMTKNAPDDVDSNGNYSWDFGFKIIKLYEDVYETRTGYEVRSVDMTPDDEANTFTKAALSVCAITHDETAISYYLSVDSGSSFHALSPLESVSPSHPQILDFSELQSYTNVSSSDVHDSNRTAIQLDIDNVSGESIENGELLLNYYIRYTNVSGLLENDIVIWRNIGDKTSSDTVRDKAKGWGYDESISTYSCYFYISDPNGTTIDFGPQDAVIDEVVCSGSTYITPGTHYFETHATNWSAVTTQQDSLDALENLDALYPYNHRLLIEGYDYGPNYVDQEVYIGASRFAESLSIYTALHTFKTLTDSTDLTVYTRDVDTTGNLLFLFKTDRTFGDYINEEFIVTYPLTNQTFDSVIFKAVLTTTDTSISPILDSYLVKLG